MLRGLPAKIVDRYLSRYFAEVHNSNRFLLDRLDEIEDQLHSLNDKNGYMQQLADKSTNIHEILRVIYQDPKSDREKVRAMRQSAAYKKAMSDWPEPLVSVRIPTYNRAEQLVEVAIASVLRQTYQNFEIIVVGDHTDEKTGNLLRKIDDKRIHYHNLPHRPWYPDDAYKRWLVVGTIAANEAVRRSRGTWIATLDDDDSFRPNHIEVLLKMAKMYKAEMVYSSLESTHLKTGLKTKIWSQPPEAGKFSLMATLYLRELSNIFMADEFGWVMQEPQDWYMYRRMREAGVITYGEDITTGDINLLPFQEKGKE